MSILSRTLVLSSMLALIVPVHAPARAEPLQDAQAAVARKDYASALRLLEPLARGGQPVAQWRLGLLYYHGLGVREDNAQAKLWFERAARQGLADAQFQLGTLYAFGHAAAPADEDPNRLAAQWFFEAASQGHAEAQYSLGILFLTGSGVTQSQEEADKWIGLAAAQGHADAKAYQSGAARPAAGRKPG
jgi:TPR repeat protein